MMKFEHFGKRDSPKSFVLPSKVVHGLGVAATVGDELTGAGVGRPLVVTDPGVQKAGLVEPVSSGLERSGLKPTVFDQISGEPSVEHVARGADAYRRGDCDALIAIGGGSAMDTAKAIGVEVAHDAPVLTYEAAPGKPVLERRIPYLVTVPTTAGTGSEVTQWAVIKDPARGIKFNVGGPLIAAHVAVIDPELHVRLPPRLTAATGVDALSHAIECYTCHFAQPLTDSVALLAMEYVAKYLRRAYADGGDIEARYGMAMAAMLAGVSYGSESAGAAHAMAQTLGGMVEVMHGECVAAMLAPVMEYNWMGNPTKFARMAQALGVDTRGMPENDAAAVAGEWVEELVLDLNIPDLGAQGVPEEDIPRYAKAAFDDPQTVGNPRDIDVDGYISIYERCFA